MNIMVIKTGGTIGSSMSDGYIATNEKETSNLYDAYVAGLDYPLHFDFLMPYEILSENLDGDYLNLLIETVKKVLEGRIKYDGILIAHGTDTMLYTAMALQLVFCSPEIPIGLISSNYVLSNLLANGRENLHTAVEYIRNYNSDQGTVFVAYDGKAHAPYALLPHDLYDDRLRTSDKFGFVGNNAINYSDIKLTKHAKFYYMKAMPGMSFPDPIGARAILLESYHSGTLPSIDDNLVEFCLRAYYFDIPVYLIGVEDRVQYESTKEYEKLHICVLDQISPIAAYMKLWFLTSLTD